MSQKTATQIKSQMECVFGLRDQVGRLAGDLNLIANLAAIPEISNGRLGHNEMLDLFAHIKRIAGRSNLNVEG